MSHPGSVIPDDQWRRCEALSRLMSAALARLDANDLEGFQRLAERVAEEVNEEKEKANEAIFAR